MKKEQVQPVLCNRQQAAHASQSSRRAWITPNYSEIDLNSQELVARAAVMRR